MKKMENKGLTFTAVFLASSANYGESSGNISTLKKVTRNGGKRYSYISRQALRYNAADELGYPLAPAVEIGESKSKKVLQYSPDASIKEYPELDFFGYMKTEKGKNAKTRSAAARISDAVSLEEFRGDMDFLTNAGLAKRAGTFGNIAQSEIHRSYYSYTVAIDLDRVGSDPEDEIEIPLKDRAERVKRLLSVFATLYRDIRGRRENLRPLFIIGGVYGIKNPFFENMISMEKESLDAKRIADSVYGFIKDDTCAGMIKNIFPNDEEIREALHEKGVDVKGVSEFFETLKEKVDEYYESSKD